MAIYRFFWLSFARKRWLFSPKGGRVFRAKVERFSCEGKKVDGKNGKRGRLVGTRVEKEEYL